MSQKIANTKRSEPSAIGKLYLIAYNSIQTFGWSYLLYRSVVYFLNRGPLDNFWDEIKCILVVFQNAAVLEVVHAAIGLVPSGVAVTLAQVYSRVFLVCGALLATSSAPRSPGLILCVLAWSITEIFRYAYYALNLMKVVPRFLLYIRYSTFLPLYPLGVSGELLCMYHSLSEIAERKLWTVSMPNAYNFIFSYYHFLILYMFLYLPLFPVLFGHMMSQRRKMLGQVSKKEK